MLLFSEADTDFLCDLLALISFLISFAASGSSAAAPVQSASAGFCAGATSDVDFPEEVEPEEVVPDALAPLDPEEATLDVVLPFGVTFTSSNVPPVPAF